VAGGGVTGSAVAGESGGGSAGATQNVSDSNLSRGKATTADSEQITRLHYAGDANDGDRSTRWCAADYRPNHYWEVDLGQTFSLSSLRILWEKDALYLFKLESSVDHTSWSLVLDKTNSNVATANQEHALPPGTRGRYVRITVTGGITPSVWASFFEVDVFGH
jgi:alpha-L-fucosidase